MARRVKLTASVGRQRITKLTPQNQVRYVKSIRDQMKVITGNYEKLINELGIQGTEILLDALQPTFELSQKYVPKDTGTLAESGFLQKDIVSKFPKVVIGYGKGGTPHYTIFVHELLTSQHTAPTKAKFLLSALEEDEANIQRRIVQGYKQVIGSGA